MEMSSPFLLSFLPSLKMAFRITQNGEEPFHFQSPVNILSVISALHVEENQKRMIHTQWALYIGNSDDNRYWLRRAWWFYQSTNSTISGKLRTWISPDPVGNDNEGPLQTCIKVLLAPTRWWSVTDHSLRLENIYTHTLSPERFWSIHLAQGDRFKGSSRKLSVLEHCHESWNAQKTQ